MKEQTTSRAAPADKQGGGLTLAAGDVDFLAARLRRLFDACGYKLPRFADNGVSVIEIAGSCIGGVLANAEMLARVAPSGEPVAWQRMAVAWLRSKAAEQAQNNERYPRHAACYPQWGERVRTLQWYADELEREHEQAAAPPPSERPAAQCECNACHAGRTVRGYADPTRCEQPAEEARGVDENIERQYQDGIHIGSGLPRETCPCGLCAKNRDRAALLAAPAAATAQEGRVTDWNAWISDANRDEYIEALLDSLSRAADRETERYMVRTFMGGWPMWLHVHPKHDTEPVPMPPESASAKPHPNCPRPESCDAVQRCYGGCKNASQPHGGKERG